MSIDVTVAGRSASNRSSVNLRRTERRDCNLDATITSPHGEARIRIINISLGGIGFMADPILALKPGQMFTLRHERIGAVRCVVRWTLHSRCGAEFDGAATASEALRTFYDSLPTGPEKTG